MTKTGTSKQKLTKKWYENFEKGQKASIKIQIKIKVSCGNPSLAKTADWEDNMTA